MDSENQKEFPEEIFLKLETEANDDPYFAHYESAEDIAEPNKSIKVGVYKLTHTTYVIAPVSIAGVEPKRSV